MSTSRAMRGGWVDRKTIPRGPNGRGLCRWCSLEVPRGRYTFCSQFCVHEWKLRSQPAYLREQVFDRDRGICACCHIDKNFPKNTQHILCVVCTRHTSLLPTACS